MLSDRQRAIVHMLSDRQGARAHSCTSETQNNSYADRGNNRYVVRQRAIVHMLSDRQEARAHSCTSETQIETIYIHFLQISNLFVEA